MAGTPGYSVNPSADSSAKGGTFDAQSQFSFGGINTSSKGQSFMAMAVVGLVALGALLLVMHRR